MRLMIIGNLGGQMIDAAKIAKGRGAKVIHVENINTAFENLCAGQGADLLMVNVDENIKKLGAMLTSEHMTIPIVAYGVNTTPRAAADAIRNGAQEYIPLPPDEELIAAVLEAITDENHSVIHNSEVMKKLLSMADQIAPSNASVLITGESGTGKEVIARYVHNKSKRADKPFISVNCAAIPENLLESELFGHEKGAFTGAMNRRIGKFEEANGGTLLLDEISEMDIKLQAKLLRAIQEREIDRVGGTTPVKVDIRILATSNRDLESSIQKGEFREDLFFRLNVIELAIPPLRERDGDISILGLHFLDKYSKANGLPPRKLSKEALEKMLKYSWKGNVRELENIMHRAVLMAQGNEIEADAIMITETEPSVISHQEQTKTIAETTNSPKQPNHQLTGTENLVGRTVADVEQALIINTLDYCLGNRTHAANILGISIRTLRNKLKQYNDAS